MVDKESTSFRRAIGGALTLNELQGQACLSDLQFWGSLSVLDKGAMLPFLSISYSVTGRSGARLWQAWDVDHESNNLLMEARPEWAEEKALKSLVCYPQITFERAGPEVRGDWVEFRQFGEAEATKVKSLAHARAAALKRYRHGVKGRCSMSRQNPHRHGL